MEDPEDEFFNYDEECEEYFEVEAEAQPLYNIYYLGCNTNFSLKY